MGKDIFIELGGEESRSKGKGTYPDTSIRGFETVEMLDVGRIKASRSPRELTS